MTEQEYQTIIAIGDALRANPMSWNQIPDDMKQTVINIMRPAPSFSQEQRDFLSRWWMEVNNDSLAAINALLPPHTVCSPRLDADGNQWINCDMFTDAVEDGGRLARVLPNLLELQLNYFTSDYWPVEVVE